MRNFKSAALFALVFFAASAARGQATCDGIWHWMSVPGTRCLDGSHTGFEYVCFSNLGPTAPLLMYLEAGGACWDGDSCDCDYGGTGVGCAPTFPPTIVTNHYDRQWSCDGQPAGGCSSADAIENYGTNGDPMTTAAFNGPNSPFNDLSSGRVNWNMAVIPYCTGDGHSGNAVRPLTTSDGERFVAYFKGYNNVTEDLAVLKNLFTPRQVVLWGASSGGAGTICNLSHVVAAFPTTTNVIDNGLSFIDATYFARVPMMGDLWGMPDTCPTPTPGDLSQLQVINARAFPGVRQALTDDRADNAEAPQSPNGDWSQGWVMGCTGTGACGASCDYGVGACNSMEGEAASLSGFPNAKVFIHDGQCHAERESDQPGFAPGCNYDSMTQSGVNFNDWIRGFMQVPGFTWDNVQ